MCEGAVGTWRTWKRLRVWFHFRFCSKSRWELLRIPGEVFRRLRPPLDLMLQPHGTPFLPQYVSVCVRSHSCSPFSFCPSSTQPLGAALCLLSTERVPLDCPHYPGSHDPSTSACRDYNHRCALRMGITITGVQCCALLTFPTIYILICLLGGVRHMSYGIHVKVKGQDFWSLFSPFTYFEAE